MKDPDLMTRKQMKKMLEEKGIWGEEQEKELDAIQENMRAIEFTVAKMRKKGGYNKATMNRYRTQWTELKNKLTALLSEKTSFLSNTIEGRSEEEEVKAKLCMCVKDVNGNRIWNSIEEFNNEKERGAIITLVNEALLFWSGLSQEIINDLPAKLVFGGEEDESEN